MTMMLFIFLAVVVCVTIGGTIASARSRTRGSIRRPGGDQHWIGSAFVGDPTGDAHHGRSGGFLDGAHGHGHHGTTGGFDGGHGGHAGGFDGGGGHSH